VYVYPLKLQIPSVVISEAMADVEVENLKGGHPPAQKVCFVKNRLEHASRYIRLGVSGSSQEELQINRSLISRINLQS